MFNNLFGFVALAIALSVPKSVVGQIWTPDCNNVGTACDTMCFGIWCGGVSPHGLAYDPNSGTTMPKQGSSTTTANFRRAAIGCVNSNPCDFTNTGLSCDEFPFASTYDGGLGCFPSGYPGNAGALYQSGVTHCANAGDNSGAGSLLTAFYSSQNLQNGNIFGINFANPTQFCLDVSSNDANCPAQGDTGTLSDYYQARSSPDNTFCPERGIGTRDLEGLEDRADTSSTENIASWVTTDDGQTLMVITGGSWMKEGMDVWMVDENATVAAREAAGLGAEDTSIWKNKTAKIVSLQY